jgi:hypothetical protein
MEDGPVNLVAVDDDVVLRRNVDDLLEEGLAQYGASRVVGVIEDDHLGVGLDEGFEVFNRGTPFVFWGGFPE